MSYSEIGKTKAIKKVYREHLLYPIILNIVIFGVCFGIVRLIDYWTGKDYDGLLVIPIVICVAFIYGFLREFSAEYAYAKATAKEDEHPDLERARKVKNRIIIGGNKVKYWFALILVILIILNPTTARFKEYVGTNKYVIEGNNLKRDYNFLLFSIFSIHNLEDGTESSYVGILGNFINI